MQARVRALPWFVAGLSVVLLLLTWSSLDLTPMAGLDPSWQAGLHIATHTNLAWGRDVAFTYGPLGFLDIPVYYYGDTGSLALLYRIVTHLILLGLLWVALRKRVGAGWALLFLVVTGGLIDDALPLIALALGVSYVVARPERRAAHGLVFPALMGAVGGVALLLKINAGITVLALVGICAIAVGDRRDRLRALAVAGAGALIGILAGWIVTGQPVGALPDYLHNAARSVSGYSGTMQIEQVGLRWEYSVAAISFLVGLAVCFASTEPRARWVALLFAAVAFLTYKEGFVRHDAGHGEIYFTTVLFAFALLPWGGISRFATVSVLALMVGLTLSTKFVGIDDVFTPGPSLRAASSQISTLWRPGKQHALEAAGRAAILKFEGVDRRTTALLRRGTVSVWPYETDLVWALNLDWKPAPVIQDYEAYTPGLDALDAKVLSAPDGPTRVLLGPGQQVDGRFPAFDTGQAASALLCHYRVEHTQLPKWLVLVRGADRCGPLRQIGSVRAAWGENVAVPAPPGPHDAVIAKVAGVQVTGVEKLRSALYKAQERYVAFNGSPTPAGRLAPATAGDGLLVRAQPRIDYPEPLSLAPDPTSIAFERQGAPKAGMPLRVDFYAMTLGP